MKNDKFYSIKECLLLTNLGETKIYQLDSSAFNTNEELFLIVYRFQNGYDVWINGMNFLESNHLVRNKQELEVAISSIECDINFWFNKDNPEPKLIRLYEIHFGQKDIWKPKINLSCKPDIVQKDKWKPEKFTMHINYSNDILLDTLRF